MQRATVAQPIVASEDWYAPPAVIDGSLAESSMEWTELLAAHLAAAQGGPPVERSRLTQALSRGDVPQKLRAEVWLTFSGANERIEKHPAVYEQLCERVASHHEKRAVGAPATAAAGSSEAGEAGSSSAHAAAGGADAANRVLEQVEKDLRRTDIGTEGVRLDAMRRVLCAYAAFNPEVGYVQGMNFIVVALLALLDERQSFWMLVLVVQDWLPDHFTRAMVGNHIDCRVLSRLTAENLPQLTERLRQLDVTVQLLTTRWFLCLWSSVLPGPTLMRLWDFLFVLGPSSTMQAALACMHMIEPSVLVTRDIGEALSGVKRVLRTADAETLLDIARVRVGEISREQLFAWRLHCRQVVLHETRHVQATRRLLKLQRSSGFALQELKLMARLCGPYTLAPADAASSLLQLTLDFEGFARALRGLVPQWKNECLLFER